MTETITDVINYFDEEQTQPADYVVQLREGLYEARYYDDGAGAPNYERVLGIFVNTKAARRALWHHDEIHWRGW